MDESAQRRKLQAAYNQANGIIPTTSKRGQSTQNDEMALEPSIHSSEFCESLASMCEQITLKEKAMLDALDNGEHDNAKEIRQNLQALYRQFIFI